MALKADLHIHTSEDPQDYDISYDSFGLIDAAKEKGFNVLSITNHDSLTLSRQLQEYASSRGIILVPGMEKTIEGRHVVFLNADFDEVKKIRRLEDIKHARSDSSMVIAPHPFFPTGNSLGRELEKYIGSFDAVEYAGFYFDHVNFNKKAEALARKHGLPLVGASDAHFLSQMGTTFTLIEAEADVVSIIRALRGGKFKLETKPLPYNLENAKIASIFVGGLWKNMMSRRYNKRHEKSLAS